MNTPDQHSHETRDFASAIAPEWLEQLVAALDEIQEAQEAQEAQADPETTTDTEADTQSRRRHKRRSGKPSRHHANFASRAAR